MAGPSVYERFPSGVPGLDEVLGGGIPTGSFFLIAGPSGAGKTVLASQIAYNTAVRGGSVVYVSFDEGLRLVDIMSGFGWDVEPLVKEGRLIVLDPTSMRRGSISDYVNFMLMKVREVKAELLVVDSLTTLIITLPELSEARIMLDFLRKAKPGHVTLLATANMSMGVRRIGVGVEEVVADGLILLSRRLVKGEFRIFLSILKVRGSAHSRRQHELMITPSGVRVVTVA